MGNSTFISGVRTALSKGQQSAGCRVVVIGTEIQEGLFGVLYSIDFTLTGPDAPEAEFSYTFHSVKSVEQNLRDLREFVEIQVAAGNEPPQVTAEMDSSAGGR